jgi:hypothetical protein
VANLAEYNNPSAIATEAEPNKRIKTIKWVTIVFSITLSMVTLAIYISLSVILFNTFTVSNLLSMKEEAWAIEVRNVYDYAGDSQAVLFLVLVISLVCAYCLLNKEIQRSL